MPVLKGRFFFIVLYGKFSCVPWALARQLSLTGHSVHLGFFGVQMVAPISMRAWAKSPALLAFSNNGAVAAFMMGLDFGKGSVMARWRVIMRSILPSTTVAGVLKAIVMIAALE